MIILFYILVTRGEKRSLRCLDSRRDGWMDGWRDDEGKFDFDEERYEGANLLIIIKIGGDESFEIHGDGWRERDRRERGKERNAMDVRERTFLVVECRRRRVEKNAKVKEEKEKEEKKERKERRTRRHAANRKV